MVKPILQISHRYRRKAFSGELYCGDAVEFLEGLPDKSSNLVFLDPPFNLGKKYWNDGSPSDRRSTSDYQAWMTQILGHCVRILKPGGALYLYHIPYWAMILSGFINSHLDFRHWIAVSMKNGFVRGQRLYPAHYALVYFTRGKPSAFRRPKLAPARCRHCGEIIKDYGGYRPIIEEKGINLSDVWDDLSPVRHGNRKHRLANELPLSLTRRVLAISGRAGQTFVDPFFGSGSAVVAAAEAGMYFKACDIVEANGHVADQRLRELKGIAK